MSASLPGADPETVSTSVAEPLERYLGQIADVTEITSQSSTGQTRITLQFDLDRDINGAARDVQAAINAAAADVSTSLSSNPTYRKVNPADAPLMIIALTSKTLTRGQLYDAASNVLQQRLSQLDGIGQVSIGGATLAGGARRAQSDRHVPLRHRPRGRAGGARIRERQQSERGDRGGRAPLPALHQRSGEPRERIPPAGDRLSQRLRRAARPTSPTSRTRCRTCATRDSANGQPSVLVILSRQPGANIIDTVDQVKAELPQLQAALPSDVNLTIVSDRSAHHPRLAPGHEVDAACSRWRW